MYTNNNPVQAFSQFICLPASPTHSSAQRAFCFQDLVRDIFFANHLFQLIYILDSCEAFQISSELLLNIQRKVSLISPTAVVDLTREAVLCKCSVAEENISNRLNVDRCCILFD